jgi:hypothetical protein
LRTPVILDDSVRPLELRCRLQLDLRRRVRRERAPALFELAERDVISRVVRTVAVSLDCSRSRFQIFRELLRRAQRGERLIAPGRKNPVDVLVVPMARGADQLVQLIEVGDGLCGQLPDCGRASLEHPLADRCHVAGREGLLEARLFFPRAYRGIGRRRLDRQCGFAARRRRRRGRRLTKEARQQ